MPIKEIKNLKSNIKINDQDSGYGVRVFAVPRPPIPISLFLIFAFAIAAQTPPSSGQDGSLKDTWDPAKYISIEEIKPGMQAYCLTCYKGTKVEKFDLDVLSIVRNIEPGRDAILVQGTDERFIRTGPVAGCSGSPVYIEGRLAGAIALAWPLSKDPLYGVTPIKDMLRVGTSEKGQETRDKPDKADYRITFDFSRPIDFAEIYQQLSTSITPHRSSLVPRPSSSLEQLPCPVVVSGLPDKACEQLDVLAGAFGFTAVSGTSSTGDSQAETVKLSPGAVLTVPLITGDMTVTALGTATEVIGDRVYGFGHSLLGYGPINLPMATGQVHTVVSNLVRSFKLGSALEIVGTLTTDESTAVVGRVGEKPKMIPARIRIDRYNDTKQRVYNCLVAHNRLLTPALLNVAVNGAALYLGDFPPDHTINYKVAIGMEKEEIKFENISTGLGVNEMVSEGIGSVALLMNNPFKEVDITSFDVDISILSKNIDSHIWSVDLSDSEVEAGQEIEINMIVESYLSEKKRYNFSLKIPDQTPPGKYEMIVCGSNEYEQFLRKAVPGRFLAQNYESLITALNNALSVERDRLYCLLMLPPGGVAVEKAELPDLPATKALILQDTKRAMRTMPFPRWLEKSIRTGTVVNDKKSLRITVVK
jgi:hypothetical protein